MRAPETRREARRIMEICNACRYCEGYCAVFPAMELRRNFAKDDVIYLANLCFECRACFYACPYTPPHDYGVNIPEVLSALRVETYADYTGPRVLSRLFAGKGFVVALTVALAVALVFGAVLLIQGPSAVFSTNTGTGAFYELVPYLAMVIPALLLSAYCLAAFVTGGLRFWRETRGSLGQVLDLRSFLRATKDAFGLEYLKGGGAGCNYPDDKASPARRWFHHLVLGGFLLDLASTTLAAIYHNFLGRDAPYPYLSGPVVLGTVGGALLAGGVLGLLWLKQRADPEPAHAPMLTLDLIFLWLLLLTSLTGLALLVLRETAAMGTLLALHLGVVTGLFLTLPYGKFAHVIYRYAALVKYQIEQPDEASASPIS